MNATCPQCGHDFPVHIPSQEDLRSTPKSELSALVGAYKTYEEETKKTSDGVFEGVYDNLPDFMKWLEEREKV